MANRYIARFLKKRNAKADIKKATDIKHITIGKYTLSANEDHKLDGHLTYFPEYSQNFPRIAFEVLKDKPHHTIIDVGANIGDTVALLRKYNVTNQVFCVEGDETYYSFLQENVKQFTNVSLLKYYLSDTDESKGYNVENSGGTARIVEAENSTIKSTLITLDKLAGQTDVGTVGILKIDTDGFDCKIIKGSLNLIEKYRPILFYEYDYDLSNQQNEKPLDVLVLLQQKGYDKIIYFDNYGRIICTTALNDVTQLKILDNYIQNSKGAFPYFDVCVFHKDDSMLYEKVINNELN